MGLNLEDVANWSSSTLASTAIQLQGMSQEVDDLVLQFTNTSDMSAAWNGRSGQSAQNAASKVGYFIQDLTRTYADAAEAFYLAAAQVDAAQAKAAQAIGAIKAIAQGMMNNLGSPPDPAAAQQAGQMAVDAIELATVADNLLRAALDNAFAFRSSSRTWITNEAARLSGQQSFAVSVALIDSFVLNNPNVTEADLQGMYKQLSTMSGDDLATFYQQLPEAEAKAWRALVAKTYSHADGNATPLSPELLGVISHAAGTLDHSTWYEVSGKLGFFEPADLDGTLAANPFKDGGTAPAGSSSMTIDPLTSVDQGQDGDCELLSTLAAIARAQPDFIRRNMVYNTNGSVTVTLYKDGKPVPVTVTNDMPTGSDGKPVYAQVGGGSGPDDWAQIYEKAYAVMNGGYESTNGMVSETVVMATVTGGLPMGGSAQPGTPSVTGPVTDDSGSVTLQDIQNGINSGQLVLAGSRQATDMGLSDSADYLDPGSTVVEGHEYSIVSTDSSAGTVTLQNPWGAGSSAPQTITLSYDDFVKYFNNVDLGLAPK